MRSYVIQLLVAIHIIYTYQDCVMKGESGLRYNIRYEGKPGLLEDSASIDLFTHLCPSLLPQGYKQKQSIQACCDIGQLKTFKREIGMLETIIPFCDTCQENIKRLTCYILCHPNQADFTNVTLLESDPSLIEHVSLTISHRFADNLFNSCKNVKFPNSNNPAISFMCTLGEDKCNPEKLIGSILSYNPFPLSVEFSSDPKRKKLDEELTLCNQSYQMFGKIIRPCSCQDCAESCGALPEITTKIYFVLGIFTLHQIIVLSCYLMFAITYWFIFIIFYVKLSKNIIVVKSEETDSLNVKNVNKREIKNKIQTSIQNCCFKWGTLVAKYQYPFIILPVVFIMVFCMGAIWFIKISSDPIEIWAPPNGVFLKQKSIFDTNFGPFYRTEQIIIKTPSLLNYSIIYKSKNITLGPVIRIDVFRELFKIQKDIENIRVENFGMQSNSTFVNLNMVCFKPMQGKCATFSVTQYFQNQASNFESNSSSGNDWLSHLIYCVDNPGSLKNVDFNNLPCMSDFSAPIEPNIVFGGYKDDPLTADVLVITFIINSNKEKKYDISAATWEKEVLKYLASYNHNTVKLSYSTERSVEDEIDRQNTSELKTVSISYVIMFLYVSIFLGKLSPNGIKSFLIHQKVMLGFVGVVIVLLSVVSSIGIFSMVGFKVNMIVLEVLPFLALAVGVDNIFLMVHEYNVLDARTNCESDIISLVGKMMSKVGQGMIVSTAAQVATFSIGAISHIPAVRTFSLFAAAAIGINFMMQITLFLVFFVSDARRERDRRPNFLCCYRFSDVPSMTKSLNLCQKAFMLLSKVILNKFIKPFILFIFVSTWFASIYIIPSIDIGLDQLSALSSDSYLTAYFNDVFKNLKIGPPLYFMIEPGFRYEDPQSRSLLCSQHHCDMDSLTSKIHYYSRMPKTTTISAPTSSWVDTYLAWLQSRGSISCCKYKIEDVSGNRIFCPANNSKSDSNCKPCFPPKIEFSDPNPEEFGTYLPWFLSDIPTETCPLGGQPLYGKYVVLNPEYYEMRNHNVSPVLTSAFMTYHTPLSSSEDMINAMVEVVKISKNLSESIHHTVVPYSMFYIFYESYFTIRKETVISFAISFVAVFIVNLLLYGFCLTMGMMMSFLTFSMILVNGGVMYLLNINLNPVSLVNLIMFIGINVEFLSHIGRAYLLSKCKTRQQRATEALTQTGSSVFSGIALTKILGISVLAMSHSQLFKIYYFQMYSVAILVGSLHGLVLLPILLSYFGPCRIPTYSSSDKL